MAQNMGQANIDQLGAWRAQGNSGDLPVGWSGGGGGATSNSNMGIPDPVETAKKLQAFTIQANQPAITTMQGEIDPLKQRYDALIANIKGAGSVQQNQQILATNNELGARGISNTSGLYQNQMAQSLIPGDTATQGALAGANIAEGGDINNLQNAIAMLQTGNPAGAITGAYNIMGVQQQAQAAQLQADTARRQQDIQQQYNQGQLSLEQANNALKLLEFQKVSLPSANAAITRDLASAGAAGASAGLSNAEAGKVGIETGLLQGGLPNMNTNNGPTNSNINKWQPVQW